MQRAAQSLNVSRKIMKAHLRHLGISKWPNRKRSTLHKLLRHAPDLQGDPQRHVSILCLPGICCLMSICPLCLLTRSVIHPASCLAMCPSCKATPGVCSGSSGPLPPAVMPGGNAPEPHMAYLFRAQRNALTHSHCEFGATHVAPAAPTKHLHQAHLNQGNQNLGAHAFKGAGSVCRWTPSEGLLESSAARLRTSLRTCM
jgi:hypothetical protein